jgi:murein DD-endopeptidase MepM/ murein hydrolase activator NlpD
VYAPGSGEPVTCTGSPSNAAAPFLSAPFAGYAEIASYLDHDQPDYAIDGKMVLATGLTVSGTPSYGVFPSYWSPQLRQWINYDGHNGYDYDISYQPVLAAANGTVTYANWESADPYYGYGQMILIRHASGYMTLYGHLSQIMVHPGEKVRAGQQIAISGTTGHSTGPHLHFTVYHNCHVVDPYGWTGSQKDPLTAFNGEVDHYLWRKGEAPEILNPLPNWPAFGSGTIPTVSKTPAVNPPLSHLLLLKVPSGTDQPPAISLATFQQQLIDERQQLLALLGVLKSQGLVQSYAVLANQGAVRVTGTVSAQQLTGLPGVAAILGDRQKDQANAGSGLVQALIQAMAPPATVALFPSTYLNNQWAWRLSVSAQEGGPYVLGFSQPRAPVHVVVTRQRRAIAWGTARGSSSNGAFAVHVADRHGTDVSILQGDTVHVSSLGKSTAVQAVPLSISAKPGLNELNGYAPPGANFEATAIEDMTGKAVTSSVTTPDGRTQAGQARYSVRLSGRIAAGDAIIARLTEASGNTLFSWTRVPGFEVTEQTSTVHGWSQTGSIWNVGVFAKKRWRAGGRAVTLPDGYVEIDLRGRKHFPYLVAAGSVLRFSSGKTVDWLRLPQLDGSVKPGGVVFSGHAPRHASLFVRTWNDVAGTWSVGQTKADRAGIYKVKLAHRAAPGVSVDVFYTAGSWNLVEGSWASRGMVIHQNTGMITGHAGVGETLIFRAYDRGRGLIGVGATTGSPESGGFSAQLYGTQGPLRLHAGDSIVVTNGRVSTSYRLPGLSAALTPNGDIGGWSGAKGRINVVFLSGNHQMSSAKTSTDRHGNFRLRLKSGYAQFPGVTAEILVGSAYSGASVVDVPLASPAGPTTRHRTAVAPRMGPVAE